MKLMSIHFLLFSSLSLLSSVEWAESLSGACYGHLQSSPAIELRSSLGLSFTRNNSLYLYTSLLENSSCTSGELVEFVFCYRPYCSPDFTRIENSPMFYVLLLLNTGADYSVVYVHRERENDGLCSISLNFGSPPSCCCRRVRIDESSRIAVNSSFAMAFLMPSDTTGGYLYGVPEPSTGIVTTPPPNIPQEGDKLELGDDVGVPAPIPSRLFRVLIQPLTEATATPSDTSTSISFVEYIRNNTVLAAGVGVAILSLLGVFSAVIFLVGLKLKHNSLKKRLRKNGVKRPPPLEDESTSKRGNLPNIKVPNLRLSQELELGGGNDQYEDMAAVEEYVHMAASPVGNYSFRIRRGSSNRIRDELHAYNQTSFDPSLPDCVDEFLVPSKDENELYAQCKWLNLTHISRDSIHLGKKLGSGQFGTVMEGEWFKEKGSKGEGEEKGEKERDEGERDEGEGEEKLEVAVKTLKKGSDASILIKFLQEAAIMGQFNHPNVVKLHGVVINGEPKMMILELLSGGDLTKVLTDMRPSNGKAVEADTPHTLLSYCRQVASGMTYLSNKGFIHRDLAARNILISEDGSCKIADFGMARDLIDENYYITQGGKIPVKWTAPEALHYKKFSTASDVWSFGVVMYEIWSLGHQPFESYSNTKTMDMLEKGKRLPPPPGCPKAMYSLMIQCWHSIASKRPSFAKVLQQLSLPDTKILKLDSAAGEGEAPPVTSLGDDLSSADNMYKELQESFCKQST